ncbi:T-cell receptor alpha chain V region CTL-L17 [Pteropus alecto]|nr:T-cell receptor alpha chain V region CTL-L17 [Pteropus alecto]
MLKTFIGVLFIFLWLQLDWVIRGEKVDQHPSTLSVQEGNSPVIFCTYSDSLSNYFPWYKQEAGKGPQLIIDIRSNKNENKDGRFTVSLKKADKNLSLSIEATLPGDSAVYFWQRAHSASQAPASCAQTCQWSSAPFFEGIELQARHLSDSVCLQMEMKVLSVKHT